MNKLIKLLNEYDKINEYINKWFRNEYWRLDREFGWATVVSSCLKVISKDYGFIKRLVDNDKIETRKIDEDRLETIQYSEKERITIYDWLLMLLAISDTPIDDLISILK